MASKKWFGLRNAKTRSWAIWPRFSKPNGCLGTAIAACLARILTDGTPLPLPAQQRARLALAAGGLGLRSAHASRQAAYWASWADSLPAIHRRLPAAADRILHLLRGEVRPLPPAVIEATQATHALRAHGFQPPAWDTLTLPGPPQPLPRDAGDYHRGWQRLASTAQDRNELAALLSDLDPSSRALLHSQAGPYASRTRVPYESRVHPVARAFPRVPPAPPPLTPPLHQPPLQLRRCPWPFGRPSRRLCHLRIPPRPVHPHGTRRGQDMPRSRGPCPYKRPPAGHDKPPLSSPGRTHDWSPRQRSAAVARRADRNRRYLGEPHPPQRWTPPQSRQWTRRHTQPSRAHENAPRPTLNSNPARAAVSQCLGWR